MYVLIYIYMKVYMYYINSLSYDFKKQNCFSRNSECDRQAVYILCAGDGVTQDPSPLSRDKASPRDSYDVCAMM